ncbi:AAC(3) family N-acetyltransferase [Nereida ignava]|uniref:AAC(3) family N-acetyltransferase n=1 Tax=Nereida ignava TaxID=282199 RepID=UPI002FE07263
MKRITSAQLCSQLKNLGINNGDVVYVKADLLSIGIIEGDVRSGLLNALLAVVGETGTIITAAYTKTFFFPMFNKNRKFFSAASTPNTGSLAKLMLKHPASIRSKHPTNSYVAIGPASSQLLSNHDHTSSSFEPLRQVMRLKGKCVIIGCIDSSPGHTTTHLAQHDLGYASQNIFKGLVGATFSLDGETKVFLRKDFGGHNLGARKIYSTYLDKGVIRTSEVGNTTGLMSIAQDAYDIDIDLLKKDKKLILCSSPTCFSCRVCWKYNILDIPKYISAKLIQKFILMLKAIS